MERFKRKLIAGIIYFGIGIVLIIIGYILLISLPSEPALRWTYGIVMVLLWLIGGILFLTGVGLLVHSGVIKIRMETNKYRRKKSYGISLTVIGIAFILIGVFIWINRPSQLWSLWHIIPWFIPGLMLLVIGVPIFIAGVGLWVHSVLKGKRRKKPEEVRKAEKEEWEKRIAAEKGEKEEKDELELEGIVQ